MSKDSLVCPRCGLLFGEEDVSEFSNLFWTCPLCSVIQHKVCRGPLSDDAELTRLRGIEAAVCSPYGKITFPYTAEKAIKTLERWVSEIDKTRHSRTTLTYWMGGIIDALEAK